MKGNQKAEIWPDRL